MLQPDSKEPIRVLSIIAGLSPEAPLGGIERFVIDLSRKMTTHSIFPTVYGLWEFGTSFEKHWQNALRSDGVRALMGEKWVAYAPYRCFFSSLRKLMQDLRGEHFDIIHSHNQFADIIAPFLKHYFSAQAVIRTIHNQVEWKYRPLRRLILTKILYPQVYDVEIGVSNAITAQLQARPLFRYSKSHVVRIYNGIDLNRFSKYVNSQSSARKNLGVGTKAFLIGSIGRLTKQKGYSYALQAFAQVLKEVPEARFMLIGSGELEEELKSLSFQLGIADSIKFTGPISQIEQVLPALDIFISSSLWEGLPTVILESMAAKVPVIATDIDGTREIITNGLNGRLITPTDVKALSKIILEFLSILRDEKQDLISHAFSTATQFSIERSAFNHASLYRKVFTRQV